MVDPFGTSTKLSAGSAQDKFLLIFGGIFWFLVVVLFSQRGKNLELRIEKKDDGGGPRG